MSDADEPMNPAGADEEEVPPTQFSQEEPQTPLPTRPFVRSNQPRRSSPGGTSGILETPAGGGNNNDDDEEIQASVMRRPVPPRGGSVAGSTSAISELSRRMEEEEDDMADNDAGGDDPARAHEEEDEGGDETLIRGTDVHVQSAAEAFRDFIRNFVSVADSERRVARQQEDASVMDEEEGEEERGNKTPLYLHKLEQILLRGNTVSHSDSLTSPSAGRLGVASLDLDALHLHFHSPACQRLYSWLVDYPAEIVPLMDILVGRELENLRDELKLKQEEKMAEAEMNGDNEGVEEANSILELLPSVLPRVQVRPYHLRNLSHMRSLDPQCIDTLLSIRGMVVRTSPIIPDLKVAFFQCTICGQTEQITIDRGRITEPTSCPTCHVRHGYSMIHNRCYFSDKQMVRVQETPDEVPAGETPASIVIFAYDDLVDAVR